MYELLYCTQIFLQVEHTGIKGTEANSTTQLYLIISYLILSTLLLLLHCSFVLDSVSQTAFLRQRCLIDLFIIIRTSTCTVYSSLKLYQ